MSDSPPAVPSEFQIYNSYEVDPIWQRKFSIVWASVVGAYVLFSLPKFIRSICNGEALERVCGIWEDLLGTRYKQLDSEPRKSVVKTRRKAKRDFLDILRGSISTAKSLTLWTLPLLGIDLGQLILIIAYYVLLLCCITLQSELVDNPNRAGFMAIAQLPVVFLFAMKNSPLAFLLGAGHGWEKINILHRWSGRGMVLSAIVHGALWIRNHREYGLQILGAQKETSGVASLALLLAIALLSIKPVRVLAYEVFFILHIVAVVAFFITLCYHTIYVKPYIFPPLAFYGLDLLLRMVRYRVKDATLIATDKQMTIIRVENCDGGWLAGQHVRLRVFFGSRFLESHPLTIMSAPPQTSCLSEPTVYLGVRSQGDWSKALNAYTHQSTTLLSSPNSGYILTPQEIIVETTKLGVSTIKEVSLPDPRGWAAMGLGARAQVLIEGPYGGSSVDPSLFSRVLLLAGGSGVTFTLGLLDDIVGRCVRLGRPRNERAHRVEFIWCIRSFGAVRWVSPLLSEIMEKANSPQSTIDVHVTVYVTCLCDPEALPSIPNCDVIVEKPSIQSMLDTLASDLPFTPASSPGEEEYPEASDSGEIEKKVGRSSSTSMTQDDDGSIAICAAGPESMAIEARNAVARLALRRPMHRIECHTEVYSI